MFGLIAAVVGILAALFLALRAWRSHGVSFERSAVMIVAWVVIIAIVTFVAARMGA